MNRRVVRSDHRVPVVAEVGLVVEGVQPHRGVQAGLGGAEGRGAALAAGDLIGQDEFEERGVAQVLLAGQDEPFGQGVGHPAELQGAQGAGQVDADRVDRRRRGSGHGGHRGSCSKRVSVAGPSSRTRVNVAGRRGGGPVTGGWSPTGRAGPGHWRGLVGRVANSAGWRANRPPGMVPVGSRGRVSSVARSSMEAILVTDTTSRSRARVQAASTGSGAVAADQAQQPVHGPHPGPRQRVVQQPFGVDPDARPVDRRTC